MAVLADPSKKWHMVLRCTICDPLGLLFKILFLPFIRDHTDSDDCTLGYKATLGRRFRMKGGGGDVVLKHFSIFR